MKQAKPNDEKKSRKSTAEKSSKEFSGKTPSTESQGSRRERRADSKVASAKPTSRTLSAKPSAPKKPSEKKLSEKSRSDNKQKEAVPENKKVRVAKSESADADGDVSQTKTQPAADEKLQKVLARAGLGSRRELEKAIDAGEVKVNDRVAKLGDRVTHKDKIFLRGHRVLLAKEATRRRVILYNKPEGEICSRSDPEGRRTVYENLPVLNGERWISIGRLDFNTSGLLLFTNDGELANKLMHPSSVIDREYLVRIQGEVDEEMRRHLLEGVMLEDGVAKFTDIVDGAGEARNRWFYCVVMEGRNREVRRLWESQGVKVSRLKRVRYANIFIPSHVRVGQWTELTDVEIADLCKTAGFESNKHTKITKPTRDEKTKQERHENKLRAASVAPRRPRVKPKAS